jgi:O-antigen ligase
MIAKNGKRGEAMGKTYKKRKQKPDWMEVWTGLFIAFYLLFPGFEGFSDLSGSKLWTFYALMGLLLIPGAAYLIRDLRQKRLRSLTPAQLAALAFWICTMFSAAFSPIGAKAWTNSTAHEAALTVSLYVLLFLIVSRWGLPTERLFRILFWALCAFCLICLLQALGGNPLGLYPAGLNFYDGYGVRYKGAYAGTIGNVDIVSAFLALVVPMLLLHTRGQKPKEAWPCWVLAAVCVGLLFWLQVLCGLVGLVMGAAVCLLVLCPDARRKWILLAICLLGFGALAVLWAFDLPVKFLHELHEILHGRFDDSFGTGRFYIWRQMLERIPDRLWLGVGPDMARFSKLSPFIRYDETGAEVARATITDAHCYPLHILYCQGLPALLSWLGVVGMTICHWIRDRKDRAVSILGGGLVCFLCAMLFCFSSVIVMPFFWLTMALLEAKANQESAH